MNCQARAKAWIENPYFDLQTRTHVESLLHVPQELESAFFTELKFGTGGLRGIMGVGTARMNIYTIRRATQGVANYLKKQGNPTRGVVIGFDSRHNSELFAHETARILIGNNIPVFLCPTLRPTPFISFACRHFNAAAAVMITASHNPKEYNGYKVYWDDGAQIVFPHDKGISQEIENISSYSDILLGNLESPLLTWIDDTVDTAYLQALSSHPAFSHTQKNLKICYSSLHGAGITLMPQALQACGFAKPIFVPSQCDIDPDFSSVSFPNPESPVALQAGIQLLQESNSDILFVTDPDADRLGVVIQHNGTPITLSGHQLAAIGAFYLCQTAPPNSYIVTTIVTTPLISKIAEAYNVDVIRVLTGFKYIGEKIRLLQDKHFLFGAEESFGYLLGTTCRDKDGIAAACLFATIAADLKSKGQTLLDLLYHLYHHFGVFQEKTLSIDFLPGKEGLEKIQSLMQTLRANPPDNAAVTDYITPIGTLPSSDVLLWTLQEGSTLIMRPSGTEPKLKVYLTVYTPPTGPIELLLEKSQSALDHLCLFISKWADEKV